MDRINIQNLKYYSINKMGSEGIINMTKYGIFKRFNPMMPINIKKKKEKKLLLLDQIDEIKKYYANPLLLVDNFSNEYITGYIIEICKGKPLNEIFLLPEERLDALRQLKKILIEFEQHNVIYKDIHFDNIFYDEFEKKVKLIDIDNIKIDEYSEDTISFLTNYYNSIGGSDDKKCRIYSFNIISYMLLFECTSSYNTNYLKKQQNKLNLNKQANILINQLLNQKINTSCDNEYLIDIVDEKMLIK